MTDVDLVEKKLAFLHSCLEDLRRLAKPEALATDMKERRFVEHTLQLAVQAALDVASHIVADAGLGEVTSYAALFDRLHDNGWLDDPTLVDTLKLAAAFRNVLVHGYTEVDLNIVKDVLENRLAKLARFAQCIAARLRS